MNSPKPLVSIIVRTKNEERWIASCLRSIFQQTYDKLEVILVDNESIDLTIKKAKEVSDKDNKNIRANNFEQERDFLQ